MKQPVRADRTHVSDEHAEQRVEVVRKPDEAFLQWVGCVTAAMPVRHRDQLALPYGGRAAGRHGPDGHVPQLCHRVRVDRRRGQEETELGVPAPVLHRVRAAKPGQLGSERHPAETGVDARHPRPQRRVGQLAHHEVARPFDDQGAHPPLLSRHAGTPSVRRRCRQRPLARWQSPPDGFASPRRRAPECRWGCQCVPPR